MEIIGIVFCDSLKLDIIKNDDIFYCGECLFVYNNFNQAQQNIKLIKLDDLPKECIIKFFDLKTK